MARRNRREQTRTKENKVKGRERLEKTARAPRGQTRARDQTAPQANDPTPAADCRETRHDAMRRNFGNPLPSTLGGRQPKTVATCGWAADQQMAYRKAVVASEREQRRPFRHARPTAVEQRPEAQRDELPRDKSNFSRTGRRPEAGEGKWGRGALGSTRAKQGALIPLPQPRGPLLPTPASCPPGLLSSEDGVQGPLRNPLGWLLLRSTVAWGNFPAGGPEGAGPNPVRLGKTENRPRLLDKTESRGRGQSRPISCCTTPRQSVANTSSWARERAGQERYNGRQKEAGGANKTRQAQGRRGSRQEDAPCVRKTRQWRRRRRRRGRRSEGAADAKYTL